MVNKYHLEGKLLKNGGGASAKLRQLPNPNIIRKPLIHAETQENEQAGLMASSSTGLE